MHIKQQQEEVLQKDLKHNDSIVSFSSLKSLVNNNSHKISSKMNNKEPVKLTTTNALQSEFEEADVKISQKNCNLQLNFVPPDGGTRAWLIMVFSFLCNGVIFGIINSSGVLFAYIKENFQGNEEEAATKASLVASLAIGTTFLLSPISSILVDKFGIRKTAFTGGFIATLGMFLSSFYESIGKIEWLYLTFGIMFGGGSSLTYTPSLVILGHYFKRHMGMVNGFVTTGSSIFTLAMPHILQGLLSQCGFQKCLLFLTALTSIQMMAAVSFKPLMPPRDESEPKKNCLHQIINVDNWKNMKYVIWALAIPSALFGYFVPYVHIVQHVKEVFKAVVPESEKPNGGILVTCIAATSGIGRLIFGKVADLPKVNRILLQQISFVSIGACTMLLAAAPKFTGFEWGTMIIISLFMGLFDGCFITMLGPIAYDLCGPSGASQAVGFLLGLCSIPLTIGPLIAGILYDTLDKDYTVAFIVAGIPPIIGAILMCLIYRMKAPENNSATPCEVNIEPLGKNELKISETSPALMQSLTATTSLSAENALETESLLVKNGSTMVAMSKA